jgi:hypothetical protein
MYALTFGIHQGGLSKFGVYPKLNDRANAGLELIGIALLLSTLN